MAIPLKIDTTFFTPGEFAVADALQIDTINRRSGSGNLTIGSNLGATEELVLGSATSDVRVLGDLIVDGSSTISVNETVVGTFSVEGDVNLGNNDGDIINLGGGTSDVVNLLSNLIVGAGLVSVGTSATDYLSGLWLQAVNDNGPNLDAYNLRASGTNAGAYSIGVDPALLTNASATDLMTVLDQLDAAITASGTPTLQDVYNNGNTIAVTSAEGIITFSNDTTADTTTVLSISRTPASSTGGTGLDISMGSNATGVGLLLNNSGSGNALQVQDGGSDVFVVSGAGAVSATPTSGENLTLTVAGAGVLDLNAGAGGIDVDSSSTITLDATGAISLDAGAASNFSTSAGNLTLDAAAAELVFDDVGNSGITLSQSADRVLDQTGTGEVLNGATSIIGAINRLARKIDVSGAVVVEYPIANGVTITAGDCVAASTTSGRVTQADADASNNIRFVGIALNTGTGDVGGTVVCRFTTNGLVTDSGATFTAGDTLFVPEGPGRPSATPPGPGGGDAIIRIGYALSATQYVLLPQIPVRYA